MAQRVVDHGDLRKYRTEIPNIVFTLDLSPYELALYCLLKKTAGADGTCWKSTATLAKESGMSSGMVSKAKVALQAPIAVLGKPLITVEEEPNKKGGKPKHCITLTDIWPENFRLRGSSSPCEVENEARSQGEVASSPHEQASSPHEIKKELREEVTNEEGKRDFMAELRGDPFYSHIDFDSEIEGMRRWLARPENRKRRLTERFVLNWIGKVDRPVAIPETRMPTILERLAKEAELKKRMGWDKFDQRTA